MEVLGSNIKKFQDTKTPKINLLIFQETETLKKLFVFWQMEIFSPTSKKEKNLPLKNFFHFLERKLFLISENGNPKKVSHIFFKGSCSYISRNRNPPPPPPPPPKKKKIPYTLEKELFYILGNRNFKKFLYF